MHKTVSPSYSLSQANYVEAEVVGFSRFLVRFHKKRTASTASASTSLIARAQFALRVAESES